MTCKCGFSVELRAHQFPHMCRCGARYDSIESWAAGVPSILPPRPSRLPSLARRGRNWLRAMMRWNLAGRPVRTEAEIEAIRAKCRDCPGGYFDGTVCTHPSCGCAVSRPGVFGDKVRIATEHCPIGEW